MNCPRLRPMFLVILATVLSCGGGDLGGGSPIRDASSLDGRSGGGDGGGFCPESPPKVGDRCPPDFPEEENCDYEVSQCTSPEGQVYPDYNTYCCRLGLWQACGGRSVCDKFEAGVPAPDAAGDAPAPDGARRDGAPDGGAPVDAAIDAPADAPAVAPDASLPPAEDGGGEGDVATDGQVDAS